MERKRLKSKSEKVKFSWESGFISKPGDGEVLDVDSYQDEYVDGYVILLIISFMRSSTPCSCPDSFGGFKC